MKYAMVGLVCLSQTAYAQNAPDPAAQQVMQQVLSQRLLREFNNEMSCGTNAAMLQTQLDAVKKELADLKAKDAK